MRLTEFAKSDGDSLSRLIVNVVAVPLVRVMSTLGLPNAFAAAFARSVRLTSPIASPLPADVPSSVRTAGLAIVRSLVSVSVPVLATVQLVTMLTAVLSPGVVLLIVRFLKVVEDDPPMV